MAVPLIINGVTYSYPELTDEGWGPDATNWAVAITQGTLQKTGGLFSLTGDVDFGPSFGLKSIYLKSRSSNIALSGVLRLSNTDSLSFRNSGNSADLAFKPGSSDAVPQYNSIDLVNLSTAQTLTNKTISGGTFSGGTFNSPTINTPTVSGGTFSSPAISSPTITGGTLSSVSLSSATFSNAASFANGTVSLPSITFTSEPSTGIYRPGAGTVGLSILGTETLQLSASSIQGLVQFAAPASPSPGYAFSGDLTTGVALGSGNALHLVQGGVTQLRVNGSSISTTTSVFLGVNGAVGSPSYSFSNGQTTGIYLAAANQLGLTAGGVLSALMTSAYSEFYFPVRHPDGSASAPTVTFLNEVTTGFFRDASGSVSLTSGGTTNRLHISNSITNASMALLLNSNGGGTGDQLVSFAEASSDTQAWSLGRDDSNTGAFTLSQKFNSLGTNNVLSIAIDGSYQIGSAAYSGNNYHFVYGSLSGNSQSAASNWNISNQNQMDLTINLTRPASGTMKALATQTGYVWSTFSRPTASTDSVFEIDSNYQDAQTQGSNVVQTSQLKVFSVLASGLVSVRSLAITNGQLTLPDGSQGAPGIAFTAEPSTGLYRPSGGVLGVSTNGTLRLQINPTSIQAQVPFAAQDGTAGAPSHTFINDLTSGMYRAGSNILGISAGGTELVELLNGVNPRVRIATGQFSVPSGTLALPGYTFESEQNSGFYRDSGGAFTAVILGASKLQISTDISSYTNFAIRSSQLLKLLDNGNTNYVGLNAPTSVPSTYTVTLPASAPSTNTSLAYNGTNYVWSPIGSPTLNAITLTDNTTNGVAATFTSASTNTVFIKYSLKRGSNFETGELKIVSDGTTPQIIDASVQIGDCGTSFTVDISGGNLRLLYTTTSTGTAVSMKYTSESWQA